MVNSFTYIITDGNGQLFPFHQILEQLYKKGFLTSARSLKKKVWDRKTKIYKEEKVFFLFVCDKICWNVEIGCNCLCLVTETANEKIVSLTNEIICCYN